MPDITLKRDYLLTEPTFKHEKYFTISNMNGSPWIYYLITLCLPSETNVTLHLKSTSHISTIERGEGEIEEEEHRES